MEIEWILSSMVQILSETAVSVFLILLVSFVRRKISILRQKRVEFRGWLTLEVAVILVMSFIIPYQVLALIGWKAIGIVVGLIIFPISAILSMYLLLAPNNCHFTLTHENTAKFVMMGGAVDRVLIQKEGYTLDDEGFVVKNGTIKEGKTFKEPWHPLKGLRFYGIWPTKDILIYPFSWTGVTEDGQIQPHDKVLIDYILLKDDTYRNFIPKAEDSALIPLDLDMTDTFRVVNPKKAKFDVQNWLETAFHMTNPTIRQFVGGQSFETLIPEKQNLESPLWDAVKKDGLAGRMEDPPDQRGELINRYGVEVRRFQFRDIKPRIRCNKLFWHRLLQKDRVQRQSLQQKKKKLPQLLAQGPSRNE